MTQSFFDAREPERREELHDLPEHDAASGVIQRQLEFVAPTLVFF